MGIEIRLATGADVADITALWNRTIRETVATFEFVDKTADEVAATLEARRSAGKASWVAFEDGQFLGFASYFQFRPGNGYARTMEHSIMLWPSANGRGAGRALMAELLAHARAAGAHSMIAAVTASNEAGVAFHTALGFEKRALLADAGFKNGQYLDLQFMQKML